MEGQRMGQDYGLQFHCHLAHRSQDQANVNLRGPLRPAVRVTSVLVSWGCPPMERAVRLTQISTGGGEGSQGYLLMHPEGMGKAGWATTLRVKICHLQDLGLNHFGNCSQCSPSTALSSQRGDDWK